MEAQRENPFFWKEQFFREGAPTVAGLGSTASFRRLTAWSFFQQGQIDVMEVSALFARRSARRSGRQSPRSAEVLATVYVAINCEKTPMPPSKNPGRRRPLPRHDHHRHDPKRRRDARPGSHSAGPASAGVLPDPPMPLANIDR